MKNVSPSNISRPEAAKIRSRNIAGLYIIGILPMSIFLPSFTYAIFGRAQAASARRCVISEESKYVPTTDKIKNSINEPIKPISKLITMAAGGITESSDSGAGGAVSQWSWSNAQFINTADFGRYMQADIIYECGNVIYNPIEAGDRLGMKSGRVLYGHTSSTYINIVSKHIHYTRAIPVDYGFPVRGVNISPHYAYIYPNILIGKNLWLNFKGLGPVARYQTIIYVPHRIDSVSVEIPTAYLQKQYHIFYGYDAGPGLLYRLQPGNSCALGDVTKFTPSSGYGGVIISDSAEHQAMGVYSRTAKKGGAVTAPFGVWDFRSCGDTTKWNAVYFGALKRGKNVFDTFVISGTVLSVRHLMDKLRALGF